ncbi:Scr1 family TA system antitoxin-like transcriptional regulator [Streptomyces sp. NEAU-W12]|uniref:Scr1 family TA system antitoxin-like transcriptional regulator n=1 Tax=Streptomyces sp. NEAU-W12 TaxID=2994668 RepID=UPI002B056D80|nr:Scr1 family TA system antitoxin-like transcriptional regulator [Streptomyces sp. NEAU-W12]
MSFVIDESVPRRPIGGQDVSRGQWEQVLLAGRKPTVEIQVVTLGSEENAGMAGPFILVETTEAGRAVSAAAPSAGPSASAGPPARLKRSYW